MNGEVFLFLTARIEGFRRSISEPILEVSNFVIDLETQNRNRSDLDPIKDYEKSTSLSFLDAPSEIKLRNKAVSYYYNVLILLVFMLILF